MTTPSSNSHDQASTPPFGQDFRAAVAAATADQWRQDVVTASTSRRTASREVSVREFPDPEALRNLAGEIRQHTIDHLDFYLQQLVESVERNGGHVHFAADTADARRIILKIARDAKCSRVIKSKSMVSEEIQLDPALEEAGLDVVETDLGEFVVQIAHDRPSHIVAPIVHKNRQSVGKLFSEYFKTPYTDDPRQLTMQARAHLRDKFRRADLGMTGANFVVAETGHVCVVENEGNARQSVTTPRVLVTLTGIEKVIPRLADLGVLLKLLVRFATAQPMGVYTNLFSGPRREGEKDGPEEFHLVLLDNGRSEILAGQYREMLRCIRCGSCLNACPVYRKIGGHAYGSVYMGPIGAIITPLFHGLGNFKDLPQASSLCGACKDACPVKIDLPHYLVKMRTQIVQSHLNGRFERMVYRLWAFSMRFPRLYRWSGIMQRFLMRRRATGGWISKLPLPASGWTQVRDMPAPAGKSFHRLWKERQ